MSQNSDDFLQRCRECRGELTGDGSLCLKCQDRLVKDTRSELRERLESGKHRRLLGFIALGAMFFLMHFLLLYIADPQHRLVACALLSSTFTGGIVYLLSVLTDREVGIPLEDLHSTILPRRNGFWGIISGSNIHGLHVSFLTVCSAIFSIASLSLYLYVTHPAYLEVLVDILGRSWAAKLIGLFVVYIGVFTMLRRRAFIQAESWEYDWRYMMPIALKLEGREAVLWGVLLVMFGIVLFLVSNYL